MSALTVTFAADTSALKRGMAAASQLVAASARRMSAVSAAGLAGIGKGGAAVLESEFASAGTAMNTSIASALAGGAAAESDRRPDLFGSSRVLSGVSGVTFQVP